MPQSTCEPPCSETDGFVRAPAAAGGCWHGYAYPAATWKHATTMPSFATCGMPRVLRVGYAWSGVDPDLRGRRFLGFNVNQPLGGSRPFTPRVPPGHESRRHLHEGQRPGEIRVQTRLVATPLVRDPHREPGRTIPYAMFNTARVGRRSARNGAYAKQPLEAVQLVAPGAIPGRPHRYVAHRVEGHVAAARSFARTKSADCWPPSSA